MTNVNSTDSNSAVAMTNIQAADKGDSKDVTTSVNKTLEDSKEMLVELTKLLSYLQMIDQVFNNADKDAKETDKAKAKEAKGTASKGAQDLKNLSLAVEDVIDILAGVLNYAMQGASAK